MIRSRTLHFSRLQKIKNRTLFYITVGILAVTFGTYVFLVNKTIMNVVARERIESSISSLSTTMSGLEFKYITLKNAVTLEVAHEKGFQDVAPTQFIARGQSSVPLSYNFSH